MKMNDFWMLRLSRLIATDSNPKTENKMKKGKDIFNVIKLEEKGASAKLLQLQLMANENLRSEQKTINPASQLKGLVWRWLRLRKG